MADAARLDGHSRTTLQRVFGHPMPHNLQWHDVWPLLGKLGSVTERGDGRMVVTVGTRSVVFEPGRQRDVGETDLRHLRQLLADAGVVPLAAGEPPGGPD